MFSWYLVISFSNRLATKTISLQICAAEKVSTMKDVWLGKLIMVIIKEINNWNIRYTKRICIPQQAHRSKKSYVHRKCHSSCRKAKKKSNNEAWNSKRIPLEVEKVIHSLGPPTITNRHKCIDSNVKHI